jgi:hypothetical protein
MVKRGHAMDAKFMIFTSTLCDKLVKTNLNDKKIRNRISDFYIDFVQHANQTSLDDILSPKLVCRLQNQMLMYYSQRLRLSHHASSRALSICPINI